MGMLRHQVLELLEERGTMLKRVLREAEVSAGASRENEGASHALRARHAELERAHAKLQQQAGRSSDSHQTFTPEPYSHLISASHMIASSHSTMLHLHSFTSPHLTPFSSDPIHLAPSHVAPSRLTLLT